MKKSSLDAICDPRIETLMLKHKGKLQEWVNGLGSPLHLLFPDIFQQNIEKFKEVLNENKVDYQLLFAKKANKAQCFAQICAQQNIGIDVASISEFELALSAGIKGYDIGVSGPHKCDQLLSLAIMHNALIAIDSLNELTEINALVALITPVKIPRVLLRFSPKNQSKSRFGMAACEMERALTFCVEWQHKINLQGFSCHLSGYCTKQRGQVAHQLIDYIMQTRTLGLNCQNINIGGGFAVSYLASADWQSSLNEEVFHADKQFSGFYPYHNQCAGDTALKEVLQQQNQHQQTLTQRLRDLSLCLMLEPGRALLDQAGISLFSVQGCKPVLGYEDRYIATVKGMSYSLSEQWFNSEFLPSPKLISKNVEVRETDKAVYKVAVAGNSCLDDDMLTWRFVPLPQYPNKQDIFAYINTAGYQMDSNESAFHSTKLPRKIAVCLNKDDFRWQLESS
jgi:diaminopimelate decarboxylase